MVGRIVQGVIQECCECEVADEPVVVSKARPMKASKAGRCWPTTGSEGSHRKLEVHNESEPDSARQVGKRAK
ncbi:hypothetical protein [Alteromonas mediterranea]|uniref:Uncharacterized protein n=1 Tax=Alteromonas mediterranea (strain DSM 17117 / CIP 110805 / LMG 28347 / Deep ecotype) TaxID=1774373 RepID=T2DM74_ALTMD|nr:hypothetical protein [Alteromonas mediterranea]AGV54040.1 hypothetical protein MADE_000001022155 [Alteromonas mediterranea DE]